MQKINYNNNNKASLKSLSKIANIGVLAIASCLIGSAAQAAPSNNWSIQSMIADCHGTSSYGRASTSCQSYADDIYENWNPNDGGAGDTDIKTLSLGSDNDYFYFELDLRQNWNDESRHYYLEISDGTSGYYLFYQPKHDDLGSNWKNMGGSGEVEVYTGSPENGYNNDLSSGKNLSSGDFYVRLVDGNVQMALKKSKIGSPNTISTRAYAAQNSTLEKDKVQWNKHNTVSDLDGFGGFDSTEWLSLNPNSIDPSTDPNTGEPATVTPPTEPPTVTPPTEPEIIAD